MIVDAITVSEASLIEILNSLLLVVLVKPVKLIVTCEGVFTGAILK